MGVPAAPTRGATHMDALCLIKRKYIRRGAPPRGLRSPCRADVDRRKDETEAPRVEKARKTANWSDHAGQPSSAKNVEPKYLQPRNTRQHFEGRHWKLESYSVPDRVHYRANLHGEKCFGGKWIDSYRPPLQKHGVILTITPSHPELPHSQRRQGTVTDNAPESRKTVLLAGRPIPKRASSLAARP